MGVGEPVEGHARRVAEASNHPGDVANGQVGLGPLRERPERLAFEIEGRPSSAGHVQDLAQVVVAVNPLQGRPRDVFRRRVQGVDPLAMGGQPRNEGHGLVGALGPRPPEPGPAGGVGLGRSAAGGELLVNLPREGAQALDGVAFLGSLDRSVGVELAAVGPRHLRRHCAPRVLRTGQELLRHEDVRDLPGPRHAGVAEQARHRAAVGEDPREEHVRVLSRAEHPKDLDYRPLGVRKLVDHGGVGLLAGQLVRAGSRCARRAGLRG